MPNPSRTTSTRGRVRVVRASVNESLSTRRLCPARCGRYARSRDDAGHLIGLEARAANQRTVEVRLGKKLLDRGARHAPAIEHRDTRRAERHAAFVGERCPDKLGHRRGIAAACSETGADRPYRLVGNNEVVWSLGRGALYLGQRPMQLAADRSLGLTRLAILEVLPDTKDWPQAVLDAAQHFAPDQRVVLELIASSLAVAADRPRREHRHHGRGDLAGEGAERFGV